MLSVLGLLSELLLVNVGNLRVLGSGLVDASLSPLYPEATLGQIWEIMETAAAPPAPDVPALRCCPVYIVHLTASAKQTIST